jgi:hypothetical protein
VSIIYYIEAKKFFNNITIFVIRKVLDCADSPIVFVHYDTHMCNIIKTYPNLTMIDYDFAGYLPRGFEFGQFFTDMAFNKHTKTYPYFEYNHDRYPSREYQMDFFNTYIERLVQTGKKKEIKYHPALKDLNVVSLEYETNVCLLMSAIISVLYGFIHYEEFKAHNFGGMVTFCSLFIISIQWNFSYNLIHISRSMH